MTGGSGHNASTFTLGGGHTCALRDNGHVVCWGLNSDGQLGIGNTTSIGIAASQMGNNLVEVDVGSGFLLTCLDHDISCPFFFLTSLFGEYLSALKNIHLFFCVQPYARQDITSYQQVFFAVL